MNTKPNIQILQHNSKLLQNSLFKDPCQRDVPVYVPPHYDVQKQYPSFYILKGWGGCGNNYLQAENVFSQSLPQLLDQAITEGSLDPCIVVFPNCQSKLGGSQYINSITTGPYMDYLCDELVPFVDQNFSTHADTNQRAVLGHSSGGFGALLTGFMRPDIFSLICSSAADSFFEHLFLPMIPKLIASVSRYGSIEKCIDVYLSSPNPMSNLSRDLGESIMLINMCVCFIPNSKQKHYFADIFFDLHNGKIDPELWQKFLAWDPIYKIDEYKDKAQSLKHVLLECGKQDQYALHLGHRQIKQKLDQYNISNTLNEYQGRHSGHNHRFIERIQFLMSVNDKP